MARKGRGRREQRAKDSDLTVQRNEDASPVGSQSP